HRHPPPFPVIEISAQARPTRVWRQYREGHAFDTLVNERMGTQLAIAREMIAFAQKVQIELAEHWREAVNIAELALYPADRGAQAIAELLLPAGHRRDKNGRRGDPNPGPGQR